VVYGEILHVNCDIPFDVMSNIVRDRLRCIGTYVNGAAIQWLDKTYKVISFLFLSLAYKISFISSMCHILF